MPDNLYQAVEAALLESDPLTKCRMSDAIRQGWLDGRLDACATGSILPVADPGRPPTPTLVDPRKLERRSSATAWGRVRLLHALAHIEFNAINIALDAVYRFRAMPAPFVSDWLLVAVEESRHFGLLIRELEARDSCYGAYPAHAGLWDMVCRTRDDVLHRMALVPRVMEAKGLDVTPAMIKKLKQAGDFAAVAVLEIIYEDEIGHVRIGNYWFHYLCDQRGVDAEQVFTQLLNRHLVGKLRGPFNWPARIRAGFRIAELESLERLV